MRLLSLIGIGVVTLLLLMVVVPAGAVTPEEGGRFWDDDGWNHEPNIEAIAAADITQGCAPEGTAFCPDLSVTRAQMASFLARALGLSPTGGDRFTDVASDNVHKDNINAIADAGITLGCSSDGTRYCPSDFVTRAQMASFLARALDLAPVSSGSFQDITADFAVHEQNINAIAADGITLGCNADGTLYCPGNLVIRAQMASFLARALDLSPVSVAPRLYLLDYATCDTDDYCEGSGSYPANTGFFIRHGFLFTPDDPDFGQVGSDPNTGFVLFLDDQGGELPSTPIVSTLPGQIARFDSIDFPSGLSGEHVFYGQWLRLGAVVQEIEVTIDFG